MHGLWMLVHRTGYRILIRYESWLRPDTNIQSNIEVVQIIRLWFAKTLADFEINEIAALPPLFCYNS